MLQDRRNLQYSERTRKVNTMAADAPCVAGPSGVMVWIVQKNKTNKKIPAYLNDLRHPSFEELLKLQIYLFPKIKSA